MNEWERLVSFLKKMERGPTLLKRQKDHVEGKKGKLAEAKDRLRKDMGHW